MRVSDRQRHIQLTKSGQELEEPEAREGGGGLRLSLTRSVQDKWIDLEQKKGGQGRRAQVAPRSQAYPHMTSMPTSPWELKEYFFFPKLSYHSCFGLDFLW